MSVICRRCQLSSCPHLEVCIRGVAVPCMIDTGSMVSTITETCFRTCLEPLGLDCLRFSQWLQLRAANGLSIPYVSYLELEVELCSKLLLNCGILVVKDPLGDVGDKVPGILGMNALCKCYQEVFGQFGHLMFETPPVVEAPTLV